MKPNTKVTARTIAQHLGLSMATVDRALNRRGNVKEETYQKIMEKAKELNYTPNKLASFLSRKKSFSIAVIYPEYPIYFWEQVEMGIQQAIDELGDYGLHVETFRISDKELSKQDVLIREMIQSGKFDGLALAAGKDIFIDIIDQAMQHGVVTCTFNHDSPSSRRLFYVGSDYRGAGRLAGELLCKFIGMAGSVTLLASTETSFQTQEKITGFREVLVEYPDVELIGPLRFNRYDIEGSLRKQKEQLETANGIYVVNAELGAVAHFLEELGYQKKKALVGHDMYQAIHHYLANGTVTATISQDPTNQGYYAVKKLFENLVGDERTHNKDIITKLEIITKENARFYI